MVEANTGGIRQKPYLHFGGGQCGPNVPEGEVQRFCRESEPARDDQE
jgi:hypothetical protein